jgi:integrase
MISESIAQRLKDVEPLKAGRSPARERDPVKPVAESQALEVLPFVSRQIAAMIRLQLLTGMRPGEVCVMRGCDLDTTRKVWTYKPKEHKTQHHGHGRTVHLGPQAQELIRPFLKTDITAYLFSPREAEAERLKARHAARTTPLNEGTLPGQNQVTRPCRREPGDLQP